MIPLRRMLIATLMAAGFAPLQAMADTEFRLGLITPPGHVWTKAAESFGADLSEATDGRLSVQVFPSAQLGNEAQMIQQLQTGALDMAFVTGAELSNRVPDFGAFYAPFLADDLTHAGKILRSDTAREILGQLPKALGVVGLGIGQGGMRQIVSRPDIDSAEGLKGLKIRITPFEPLKDFYTALGAAPTPMPLPAVYDALANGQVDAIDMDAELIWKMRYFEQAPTVMITNQMMFPVVGVMSGRIWKDLSDEDKATITELAGKRLDATIDKYVELDKEWLTQIEAADGVRYSEPDHASFDAAVEQWYKDWSERTPMVGALQEIAAQTR